jgi:hypothetical protein
MAVDHAVPDLAGLVIAVISGPEHHATYPGH